MDFKTKDEVLDACFCVVNELLGKAEKVSGEEKYEEKSISKKMFEEDYRDFREFETRVAKAVATRVLDKSFYIYDDNSLKKLWFDEAVNVTNEMIKALSSYGYEFFGYEFSVEKKYNRWGDEISLYIAVQDGRKEYIDDISYDCVGGLINDFVAEDIVRIATGRTLSKKSSFSPDEKNEYVESRRTQEIIWEVGCCLGCDISYSEIGKALENGKAEDGLVKVCKEIEAEYENKVYNW